MHGDLLCWINTLQNCSWYCMSTKVEKISAYCVFVLGFMRFPNGLLNPAILQISGKTVSRRSRLGGGEVHGALCVCAGPVALHQLCALDPAACGWRLLPAAGAAIPPALAAMCNKCHSPAAWVAQYWWPSTVPCHFLRLMRTPMSCILLLLTHF